MKPIYLFFSLALIFAGCSDPIADVVVDTVEEHLSFSVTSVVDDDPIFGAEFSGSVYLDNVAVGDSAWVMTVSPFFSSSSNDQAAKVRIETDGSFVFDFVLQSFGGYQDSISGSGFFSADTLYFSYTYTELSSGNFGSVSVFSH